MAAIDTLRTTPGQQVTAFNLAIGELKRAQLDNQVLVCANAAQRATQNFMQILARADQAAARIAVAAREALLFGDAGDPSLATVNGIEAMLNHGKSPDDIVRKLVAVRNRAGIRYVLDRLELLDIKDTDMARRTIDSLVLSILQDDEKAALQANKEVNAQMGVSIQYNHNLALQYFNSAKLPTFVSGMVAPPQEFRDWATLDANGNYTYPSGSSLLKLQNGMEQFEGTLTGAGVWQNAARLRR